jgi:hypothetical protein
LRRGRPSVLLRAGGGVALVVLMFATRWYGLSTPAHGSFGAAAATAAGVWSTLSVVRWLLLVAVAAGALSLLVPRGRVADLTLALGLVATGALFYRLLIVLPDPHAVLDVKIGGYLALVACAALTLGAYEAEAGAPAQPEPHSQVID